MLRFTNQNFSMLFLLDLMNVSIYHARLFLYYDENFLVFYAYQPKSN